VLKLVDVEGDHDSAQKEMSVLRRRLAEMEDDHMMKERNFLSTLEQAEQTECQLSEDRRRLVQSLDEAGTELIEMRLRLSAAEGHVTALESQLSQVDGRRLDMETKLASVVSSLRRFVGVCGSGAGAMSRSKSLSSLRSRGRSSVRSKFTENGEFVCLTLNVLDSSN